MLRLSACPHVGNNILYGSIYACVPEYLRHVIQIYVRAGLTGPLWRLTTPSDLLRLQTLVVPST